jgi:uncharacterized membrane protein
MIGIVLSNVPLGTADILSYSMLLVVAIFLISGPLITYYYWRKNKKMKAAMPSSSARAPEQSA